MLDLSNNNATGHNFRRAHRQGGQLRLMLKAVEGTHFIDRTYTTLRKDALAAGMRVGAYDFLHPLEASPTEAANYLLRRLPATLVRGRDLRPALDLEKGSPSLDVGRWAAQVAKIVERHIGCKPLIYGSGWYLEACRFTSAPGPLWLAAYGRDDGREYPVGKLPAPWRTVAAHQFTDKATVAGISGRCDLSHVFVAGGVELPRPRG